MMGEVYPPLAAPKATRVRAGNGQRSTDYGQMLRAMITAFRTLTIIPIPGKDTENFSRSLCFFPLVGALLGFVVLLVDYGAVAIGFKHPFVSALLSMTLVTWLTGGLHKTR